jgi:putative sigma-54 modulation protein
MNINIKATNVDLTLPIKQYVDEKIGNLEKFLGKIDQAHVELERDKRHRTGDVMRAEVMLTVGGKVMRADASSEDMYASIDLVVPKLKEQVTKFKNKRQTLQRRGARSAKKRK